MPAKTVVVGSSVGLHARPAAMVAQAAEQYDDAITLEIENGDEGPVDAASALLIMTLAAERGARVIVESANAAAVEAIAAMIASDLDA